VKTSTRVALQWTHAISDTASQLTLIVACKCRGKTQCNDGEHDSDCPRETGGHISSVVVTPTRCHCQCYFISGRIRRAAYSDASLVLATVDWFGTPVLKQQLQERVAAVTWCPKLLRRRTSRCVSTSGREQACRVGCVQISSMQKRRMSNLFAANWLETIQEKTAGILPRSLRRFPIC